MHRFAATALLGLALTASPALAQDDQTISVVAPLIGAAATSLAPHVDHLSIAAFVRPSTPDRRPLALPALYVSTALLQGYDAYSTLTALKLGGIEANPVMKGLTKSPAAFIGLKAGVTALSIVSAEKMWKRGNRLGAVVTMVASNSFMAYVASNNARVLQRISR